MGRDISSLELRAVTEEEFPAFARAVSLAFGEDASSPEAVASWRAVTEFDRTLAFFDGDRIVGNAGAYSFEMSLPGGRSARCAGVTTVGVTHDWRRQGLLNAMMRRQLDDIRERGEPFAALYASESPIYGRYGYAIAAQHVDLEIEQPWGRLTEPADVSEVRLVGAPELVEAGPAIREEHATRRGGMMRRSEEWWSAWLEHDHPENRDGYSPRLHALLPGRGYAVYRVKPKWSDTLPQNELLVIELVANDPEATAALWQFLFGVDLVRTVKAHMRPADDPLPWLVANHQRVKTRGGEDLYLRLVDVGPALAARGYDLDERLVFEVHDGFCGWNEGRWALEVAGGQASCERTDDEPDLELDVRDLAALSLGGVKATELAGAGRVDELGAGSLGRADRLFAAGLAPWNSFEF